MEEEIRKIELRILGEVIEGILETGFEIVESSRENPQDTHEDFTGLVARRTESRN